MRALVGSGPSALDELLTLRLDPSWTVRREVVAALGLLGDAALPELCTSLVRERDNETRIAATVDALVASNGDVEAALTELVGLGGRRSLGRRCADLGPTSQPHFPSHAGALG